MTSAGDSDVIWRFQTGPLKHLGLTRGGVLSYQKSAISGGGRLTPVHLHLAANLASGRLIAEISLPEDSNPEAFLTNALRDAATIGGQPRNIVFSREVARSFPGVLAVAEGAGAAPVFATQAFKLRQKISRHFEDFLDSQIVSHEALAQWKNFVACFPQLVSAWNVEGQVPIEEGPSRYFVAAQAVETRLGPDPRRVAEEEFRQRRIEVRDADVQPGSDPGFHFADAYGPAAVYFGFDLRFVAADRSFNVPLFVSPESLRAERTLRTFDPNRISFRKGDIPVELRQAWHIDEKQPDRSLTLRDFFWAWSARGADLVATATLMRKLVAVWHAGPAARAFQRFAASSSMQPPTIIRAAGVSYANESWERIRERHFWRTIALWDAGFSQPVPFARVQIESDGRLNVLPLNSFMSETSAPLDDLLRTLFLKGTNVVPQEELRTIVSRLQGSGPRFR